MISPTPDDFISRRLRVAGVLIVLGLIVEGLSLIWNHPLSFAAFLGVGGLLVFLGIVVYLTALVSPGQS
jgi:hypothetical protein